MATRCRSVRRAGRDRLAGAGERSCPPGPVTDLVAGAASIRALIPFATVEAHATTFAVLNADGKTVARVGWTEGRAGRTTGQNARRRGPGDQAARLRGGGQGRSVAGSPRPASRSPPVSRGSTRSSQPPTRADRPAGRFGMHANQPGDLAVADALLRLPGRDGGQRRRGRRRHRHGVPARLPGCRPADLLGAQAARRRAPDRASGWAIAEFRWLGDITTPTRDLDVYLLDMAGMRAAAAAGRRDLDPFESYVRGRREQAQRELARSADQARGMRTSLGAGASSWSTVIAAAATNSPESAEDLARTRIEHTFHQVAVAGPRHQDPVAVGSGARAPQEVQGAALSDGGVPAALRPASYKHVIGDFKELQQVLGDFQDGEVQAAGLREFAAEMVRDGTIDVDTLLAMRPAVRRVRRSSEVGADRARRAPRELSGSSRRRARRAPRGPRRTGR